MTSIVFKGVKSGLGEVQGTVDGAWPVEEGWLLLADVGYAEW